MNNNHEDIDLIDIFFIIWDGKWVILTFVSFVFLSGSAYLYYKKDNTNITPIYSSDVDFSIYNFWAHRDPNSFYNVNREQINSDFKTMFYSEKIFSDWKKNKNEYQITYNELNRITNVLNYNIRTKTDDISKFIEIFDYIQHVNDTLTSEFVSFFQKEYQLISKKIDEFKTSHPRLALERFLFQLVILEQFFDQIDSGKKLLDLYPPTTPSIANENLKNNDNVYYKYLGFIILGATIGSFVVILQNSLRNRKKKS